MNENFGQPKRVDDIRVAQAMASEEAILRKSGHNPENIEQSVEQAGDWERKEIMLEKIAGTISKALSSEEVAVVRSMSENYDTDSMESLIRLIVKMNSQK